MPAQLPARPSLEQLHKQAKDLLKAYRAGDAGIVGRVRAVIPQVVRRDPSDLTLADAQFVLAREYGFDNWANLVHHVEAIRPPRVMQFDRLAQDLAAAYTTGDAMAIREINWRYGTSFVWDHEPARMQQRLGTWYASETRTAALALADAQRMVAHAYGVDSWAEFTHAFSRTPRAASSITAGLSAQPPFYRFDPTEAAISVRGPMDESDWDALCDVMKEHRIARLNAGGMTDAGMARISRLDHVTHLFLGNSSALTDDGLRHLPSMPQLEQLDLGGPRGGITDRGLEVLRHLPELRRVSMGWLQNVSDKGVAALASCERLEAVNLMGTPTGDGAIRALTGKAALRWFHTGRAVTDAGLALLQDFPAFKTSPFGERVEASASDQVWTELTVDGPFTNEGLANLAGLDGVVALGFFWHCSHFTGEGLEALDQLPNLLSLNCDGKRCDDAAMRHIARFPRLRNLQAQGTVATDVGFESLGRSRTIERIWGRECPNLTGRGFVALSAMPALRALAISCKKVDDAAFSTLPRFRALTDFVSIDVTDEGFRHVGRCEQLETLTCMYCTGTGDAATEHISNLPRLKSYYAGDTKITDRSLEVLARMESIERLEFWSCAGITDRGVALLAALPRLREISLDGLPHVTQAAAALFPAHVRVAYVG